MALDQKMVEYIAHLARLDLQDATEIESIQNDLSQIVKMVDQISSADTEKSTPMAHPLEVSQRLRKDVALEPNVREELLKLSSETESGLFLVPNIME